MIRNKTPFQFGSHAEASRQNTGWELDYERWAEVNNRRQMMEAQTAKLADLLESVGVPARLHSDVVAVSAVTGLITDVSPWRPIRFLPSVAARDRRPMLNALRYWIEKVAKKPEQLRYVVITAGDLIEAYGDLRGGMKKLSRQISKWAHEAKKQYGIEVHFRGTEFTRKSASERGLSEWHPDTVLYHLHANVLIQPTRYLKGKKWRKFLSWTHDFFGTHWKDNGPIEDVRELVKYVVKPSDLLEGDHALGADEAKWLHETLFRMNLAQPMGRFKDFWAELDENRCKVVLVRNKYGESEMRLIGRGKRFDHSKDAEVLEPSPELEPAPEDNSPKGRGENILIGVTLPQWKHTPWSEPMLLIQNYQPRAVGRASMERLAEIDTERMLARQQWDEAGAPDPAIALEIAKQWASKAGSNVTAFKRAKPVSYKVHTSRLTVRAEGDGQVTVMPSPPLKRELEAPPPDLTIDPDAKIEDFKFPDFGKRKRTA